MRTLSLSKGEFQNRQDAKKMPKISFDFPPLGVLARALWAVLAVHSRHISGAWDVEIDDDAIAAMIGYAPVAGG
jgi:hypothetical protein